MARGAIRDAVRGAREGRCAIGVGDEIVAAGQAERIYREYGRRVAICDTAGHMRWHPIWHGNPAICEPDDPDVRDAARIISAPNARPYIVYPFDEHTGWTFNKHFRCRDHIAKLYLTDAELQRGQAALEAHGSYVLIEPFTKHQNFRWPVAKWNDLIAACPDLTFVQHTHKESPLLYGAHPEPATFREACGLVAAADVYVRSESGLCHAAAALGVPQVTIFGGCMDPDVMAGYPKQTVIADCGPGSPCGKWLPCAHCLEVMNRLQVDTVINAMRAQLRARKAA